MPFELVPLFAFFSSVFGLTWFLKIFVTVMLVIYIRGFLRSRSYINHRIAHGEHPYAGRLDMSGSMSYLRMTGVGLLDCVAALGLLYTVLTFFYAVRYVIVG